MPLRFSNDVRTNAIIASGSAEDLEVVVFSRTLETDDVVDRVLVAMDQGEGPKTIPVFDVFADGTELVDAYSGASAAVTDGQITLDTEYGLLLLEPR